MILQQYKLKSDNEIMVAWLEHGRAKVGDFVTLKDIEDSKKLWLIEEAYSVIDSSNMKDQNSAVKTFGSIQGRGSLNDK